MPAHFSRLLAIMLAWVCLLSLSTAPAQAWVFGTGEHLVKLQDVDFKGPRSEVLYLGYKYSYHAFLLPYRVTDDGYVLGIQGQKSFFKLDEARIKSLQASGQLPSPLPPYELSLTEYAIGNSLWGALLVMIASVPWVMHQARRRKRALPLFEAAVADHRGGDLDKAIDGYTRAIELDPKFAVAFRLRAKAFEGKGEARKAVSDYTKAISLEPKSVEVLRDRGTLLRDIRQFETAISDFSRVVNLTKDAADHVQRGYVYLIKGDLDRAIGDFTTAIKKAPEYADAYRYRSIAYEKNGRPDLAQADQAKARAIVGDVGSFEARAAHAST